MIRYYVCDLIGDGSDGAPWTPAAAEVIPALQWGGLDCRADQTGPGKMLVKALVNQAAHDALVADARIQWVPFVNASGDDLPLDSPVSQIPAGIRSALLAKLEQLGIPTADWTGATPIRAVLRRFIRVMRLRQYLTSDDFDEVRDVLVSAIPAAKRQRIAQKLSALGYDTSQLGGIGGLTVGDALKLLAAQNAKKNRCDWVD